MSKFPLALLALTLSLQAVAIDAASVHAATPAELQQVRNLVNKGNYLFGRRLFKEAIAEYEKALQIDPTSSIAKNNITEVHNAWAIFHYNQGHWGEALTEWETCLQLDPNYTHAKRNLNMMKQMLSARGVQLSPTSAPPPEPAAPPPPAGTQTPKMAPEAPASNVTILTPGVKALDTSASSSGDTPMVKPNVPPAPSEQSPQSTGYGYSPPGSALFPVMPKQFVTPPKSQSAGPAEALEPSTVSSPNTSASTSSASSSSASSTAVAPTPVPINTTVSTDPVVPVPRTSSHPSNSNTSAGSSSGTPSLEEQIGMIETKVYGQKQASLTVMQRLDKLERDTAGQTRSGTIVERINHLKQSFGL